ncbi:MAG: hypothetical protein ACOCXA_02755 [Planctomycetota bacterium]
MAAAVTLVAALAVIVAGMAGPGEADDYVRHYVLPRMPESAAAAPVPPAAVSGQQEGASWLAWDLPEGWRKVPATGMREASFEADTEAGPAMVNVFLLPPQGRLANVNRWRGQLDLSPLDEQALAEAVQQDRSDLGDFIWLSVVNPERDDKAFLALMIEREQQVLFVKAELPPASIEAFQQAFVQFGRSLRPAGEGE